MILIITTVWILSSLGFIASAWSTTISIVCTVIGVIAAVIPLLKSSAISDASSAPAPSASSNLIPGSNALRQSSSPNAAYHGIIGIPSLTDSRVILQRENDVKKVYDQLMAKDITAVVLTGIAGVGKSTLAALVYRYAEALRQQDAGPYTAPSLWLQIGTSVTMDDLAGTLFEALEKPLPDFYKLFPQDQAMQLFHILNIVESPRLIVLDQFEHFLDWQTGKALINRPGIGEWLDAINSGPCRCRLLLTSRPLPCGTRDYPSAYMQEYRVRRLDVLEGIDLLRKLGVEGKDEELQQVVAYCDGHIYALTLCASLVRHHHLTLSTLLNDPSYVRLWTGNVARNLLDSIFQQQLEPLQREVLQAFSVFREPVPLNAIYAILDPGKRVSHMQIQFAVEALLIQHLLQTVGEGAYQLHAIVASYAREHIAEGDDQANQQEVREAHRKAAQYYLRLAATGRPPGKQRWHIHDMHELLEAVWQQCQAGLYAEAYDLIKREGVFSDLKRFGGNATLLELSQLLLPSDHWQPTPDQAAYIYNHLGDAYSVLGQPERAQESYLRVLELCEKRDDDTQRAWALASLGRINNALGNSKQAQVYLEEASETFRNIHNQPGLGEVFTNLGWVYYDRGQMEQARNYFEQALHIFQEVGDQREVGLVKGYLGRVADDSGQKWAAQEYYEQAVHLLKGVGDRDGEGIMLANLGRVTHVLGNSEQGRQYLEQALKMIREVGDRNSEATVMNDLGMLHAETGQVDQATTTLEEALQLRQEIGNRRGESRVLIDLGNIYMNKGQIGRAKDYFEQALRLLREIGPGWREVRPLKKLGNVSIAMGQKEQALKYYTEALHICRKVGNYWEESNLLFKIGSLYLEQNQYNLALAFLLRAKAITEEVKNINIGEIQEKITFMETKIGEVRFTKLLSEIEPSAGQIADQVLNSSNNESSLL